MRTPQELFDEAFDPSRCRDPRSEEYRHGVLAALASRIRGKAICSPYQAGTAASDAFFAGIDEGRAIYRRELEDQREAAEMPYTG